MIQWLASGTDVTLPQPPVQDPALFHCEPMVHRIVVSDGELTEEVRDKIAGELSERLSRGQCFVVSPWSSRREHRFEWKGSDLAYLASGMRNHPGALQSKYCWQCESFDKHVLTGLINSDQLR